MQAVYDRAKVLKLLVLDVDGVLTDGKLYLSDSGEEIKAFNTLDGHGLKMLKASGVDVAIITGRKSRLVEIRAGNLGIAHVYQGVEDKLSAFRELIGKLGSGTLPPDGMDVTPLLDAFEREVARVPDILECHLMAGSADYLLKVMAEDTEDFARIHRQYLSRLPGDQARRARVGGHARTDQQLRP